MAIKIYFRRFTSLFLCGLLVFCSLPVQVHATDPVTAASLAITGGQLAGAGLSGEAALSLAGPVGAVVGVTLGALGINAYVSKEAQAAGKTRTRFVLDKLVIWGAQAGYTKEQLYSKIAEGISVAADGTIQLGNDVAKTIQQFGNWLVSTDGEVVQGVTSENTVCTGVSDIVTTPFEFAPASSMVISYSTGWFGYVVNAPFLLTYSGNGYTSVRIASDVQTITYVPISGERPGYKEDIVNDPIYGSVQSLTLNRSYEHDGKIVYYGTLPVNLDNYGNAQTIPLTTPKRYEQYDFMTSAVAWTMIYGDITGGAASSYDEVFTGNPQDWAENKDVLNPAGDDTPITLNPDLLNPIIDSLTDGQQATMSIIDYLEALQDAWDHALDDVQTAIGTITDTLTGIQETIAVPDEAVKNPTVTNPSVTPETTPVLDPSAVDPGTAVTGLSFDLTQIFPFCIPFDIYDMLATLSATPEAPVYHVHYEGPYNIVIDFTVDLSPWDSVAAVLRTVELLAFCIGLAYVTRSMFIRS